MFVAKKTILVTILAIVAAIGAILLMRSFYSAPAAQTAGADVSKREFDQRTNAADGALAERVVDSSDQDVQKESTIGSDASEPVNPGSGSERLDAIASFEEFVSDPNAKAEDYVLVDGGLDANRLEALSSPEDFDKFAASLASGADAESIATAERYWNHLFRAATNLNASINVSSVSCGSLVCTAKVQSPNTADLDRYLSSLLASEEVPMYAAMEMAPEATDGHDVRRIVFTTSPAISSFDFAVED